MKHRYHSNSCGACRPIAVSDFLEGTSNTVFSNWGINAFFSFTKDGLHQSYEIKEKWTDYKSKTLFESNDLTQVYVWIEEHSEEIDRQVDENAEEWRKKNEKWLKSIKDKR